MKQRVIMMGWLLASGAAALGQAPGAFSNAFVNFETAPVHPIALGPDGRTLAVCNLADARLELFDVTSGIPAPLGSVPVGLDPVSVRFRTATEAWVVNHISDSISVVDVPTQRVLATLATLDTPADVVFAGVPARAFVSCASPNTVQVFDPVSRAELTRVGIEAERPTALAVSSDGRKVYAAIFESGNGTTLVGARFRNLLFFDNAVSRTNGPYGGQNPPPNRGSAFHPPLHPTLPTNRPPPATGLIVRKNLAGRWLDDNARDWTEFVSGTNAPLTQRIPGWDLPDRDLAMIDTADLSVTYASGLMNVCLDLAVNPVSGRIAVIGTDAINEVRFEPNLKGVFVRVKLALVDPVAGGASVRDLNPHLDYAAPNAPVHVRDQSIGDPRGFVWTADGTRGYVAGMGSRNVAVIDAAGNRLRAQPIEVGEGPCGLALDEARQRLYVFQRFSSSLSVVDISTDSVIGVVALFDPTPIDVAAGRRHLYDTRRTSGLGQAACASCHVDARTDRLGWDLGDPAGGMVTSVVNHQGTLVTNIFHPMKGVMVTQTLQDIIGHEPFHWRGDRPDIESFHGTVTNLQGAPAGLTAVEMRELKDFLASIRFPPNPLRAFDNSLATNVPLRGHIALGDGGLTAGTPLPAGNAVAGLIAFNDPVNFCVTCHTLPTGLGLDAMLSGGLPAVIPPGTNGEHHFPLAFRLEGSLRSKVSQFRNLADRIGLDGTGTGSRAGFGFGHDGSVDSLTRFLNGVRVSDDRDVADLIAFLLSVSGSDTGASGPVDASPPAAVGRQLTLTSSSRPALFDSMLALARGASSRVDLIAQGRKDGQARGWFYDRAEDRFQSDRRAESVSADALLAAVGPGSEITLTVVARGTGVRLGIDRDLDGAFDRDEIEAGMNPADRQLQPRILAPSEVAAGTDLLLTVRVPPLSAPGLGFSWWKDGETLAGATNDSLLLPQVSSAAVGEYRVVVTTVFQALTSPPVRLTVVPLGLAVTPAFQQVRRGSNAFFSATATGQGPFQHQWQFHELSVPGATNATLLVSNVQRASEGAYRVIAANGFGAVTSAPVRLGVLINPSVLIPPLNQEAGPGANATFSFMISGHPPPFGFLLRKSTNILAAHTSDRTMGFLSVSNVQPSDAGTYRIVVTNAANPAPGLTLDPVTLTVLADHDQDGLPDAWEIRHGLNTNAVADAELDPDHDGETNAQEYHAGTDPNDPRSFLKIDSLVSLRGEAAVVLRFLAASNRTYTVQFRDALAVGPWGTVADVVARPTHRLVTITNDWEGAAGRYYRLTTPRAPAP